MNRLPFWGCRGTALPLCDGVKGLVGQVLPPRGESKSHLIKVQQTDRHTARLGMNPQGPKCTDRSLSDGVQIKLDLAGGRYRYQPMACTGRQTFKPMQLETALTPKYYSITWPCWQGHLKQQKPKQQTQTKTQHKNNQPKDKHPPNKQTNSKQINKKTPTTKETTMKFK